MSKQPKILIVSRCAWDDNIGTSSTLSNIFSQYDSNNLAMIYVESRVPNTKCCHAFFQIPEIQMTKQLLHWGKEVGQPVESQIIDDKNVKDEEKMLSFVRGHRSFFFSLMREILWLLGRWRSKALVKFVNDFNPDVVWLDGSANIFLDRLYTYVLQVAGKPGVIYLMDDNYTFKSLTGYRYLYHYLHRCTMKKVVSMCREVLVISPKMKREFDEIFKVDSTIITKGIDYSNLNFSEEPLHTPVRLLYIGQIIYGRDYTLALLLNELASINSQGIKVEFSIYTNNIVPKKLKRLIESCKGVKLYKAVPYNEVPRIIKENDVLLFMESLASKYSRDARLSFSTKITDYLSSGKCILAVGPEDSAPMEYFRDEKCAVIAHNREEIVKGLLEISNEQRTKELGKAAFEAGRRNHDKRVIQARLDIVLEECHKLSLTDK